MSNLGTYQTMTTLAKKFGGPIQLMLGVAVGGYFVIRVGEAGAKKAVLTIKKRSSKNQNNYTDVFVVHTKGESNEGLIFNAGDQFRVLEIDKDAVLIEKIGNTDNPYIVSANLLDSISNFNQQQ